MVCMIILFIWDGLRTRISDYRLKCISRAKEVYPNAEFKCITKTTEWCPYEFDFITWSEMEKKIKDKWNVTIESPIAFSDYARFAYLSENKNTLFLDTDVYCKERMPEMNGIGIYQGNICVIYNGVHLNFFYQLVKKRRKDCILVGLNKQIKGRDLRPYFIHKSTENGYDGK